MRTGSEVHQDGQKKARSETKVPCASGPSFLSSNGGNPTKKPVDAQGWPFGKSTSQYGPGR